jgi:hypothetical protein
MDYLPPLYYDDLELALDDYYLHYSPSTLQKRQWRRINRPAGLFPASFAMTRSAIKSNAIELLENKCDKANNKKNRPAQKNKRECVCLSACVCVCADGWNCVDTRRKEW